MARIKTSKTKPSSKVASSSSAEPSYTVVELLARAEAILADSGDGALALKFAQRASEQLKSNNGSDSSAEEPWRVDEVLGMCYMEEGNEDEAKKHFLRCTSHSSTSLLYLAQLAESPMEAIEMNKRAVDIMVSKIDLSSMPSVQQGKERAWSPEERDARLEITKALVSMVELYLTDLCFESDAEARCIEYLDLCVRIDAGSDLNAEIYSTLASVRLSQSRPADAASFLSKSLSIWRDIDPQQDALGLIPVFTSRLNLARLLLEVRSFDEAIWVLEGLEEEEDDNFEVLYLLALSNYLITEPDQETGAPPPPLPAEEVRAHLVDARELCERFFTLAKRNAGMLEAGVQGTEQADEDMAGQVKELVGVLEKEKKVTMKDVKEEEERRKDKEDGWESEEEDGGDADADAEMKEG